MRPPWLWSALCRVLRRTRAGERAWVLGYKHRLLGNMVIYMCEDDAALGLCITTMDAACETSLKLLSNLHELAQANALQLVRYQVNWYA